MQSHVIAIIVAVAGLVIIVGALVLLSQGKIALDAISKHAKEAGDAGTALDVVIGDIKIKSQYPTIALFVLALVCFCVSLYFEFKSKEQQLSESPVLTVSGMLADPQAKNYTVTYKGLFGMVVPDASSGYFEYKVPKDVSLIILEIGKSGSPAETFPIYPNKITQWPVKLQLLSSLQPSGPPVAAPETNPSLIVPADKELPPLQVK
jgi:hypothetical protein